MTLQEVYDTVCEHLMVNQKCRAVNHTGGCAYLTEHNKRCAVGAIIPEKHLTDHLVVGNPVAEDLFMRDEYAYVRDAICDADGNEEYVEAMADLCEQLQEVHDKPDGMGLTAVARLPQEDLLKIWKRELINIGISWNFQIPEFLEVA
jgi:hypothetical protein